MNNCQQSLFAENKEKLIMSALQALAQKELDSPTAQLSNTELEAIFHALTRLLASKVGYAAFTNLPGYKAILSRNCPIDAIYNLYVLAFVR